MTRTAFQYTMAGLAVCLLAGTIAAQRPSKSDDSKPFRLPQDKRILALHGEFAKKAAQLALEYERNENFENARIMYEQILKVLPDYATAKKGLERVHARELTANRKIVQIDANKGWQRTGIVVREGKPLRISASGRWTFQMKYQLSPEGIEIPEELKEFKLGSLIGRLYSRNTDSPPFEIGGGVEIVAEQTGSLQLRMHDMDPGDNTGTLRVQVIGSFVDR